MDVHNKNILSNPHQLLSSNLDAEYRIELDQYKEESDSDVSWKTNFLYHLSSLHGNCCQSWVMTALPRQQVRSATIPIWKLPDQGGLTTTGKTGSRSLKSHQHCPWLISLEHGAVNVKKYSTIIYYSSERHLKSALSKFVLSQSELHCVLHLFSRTF